MTNSADLYGDDAVPDIEEHDISLDALNTVTRRLVRAKADLERLRAPYHAEIRRLSEREDWATAPLAQRILFLNEQVRTIALGLLDQDPKVKSWKLPHATVQSRRLSAEIVIDDEAALIEWATDTAPELLVTTPKIDKRAVKQRLSITPDETVMTTAGELVPGVAVKPERISVTVSEATPDDESEF